MLTLRQQQINEIKEHVGQGVFNAIQMALRSCLKCSHFSEPTEQCKIHLDRGRPPARIIAYGCDDYVDGYDVPY